MSQDRQERIRRAFDLGRDDAMRGLSLAFRYTGGWTPSEYDAYRRGFEREKERAWQEQRSEQLYASSYGLGL